MRYIPVGSDDACHEKWGGGASAPFTFFDVGFCSLFFKIITAVCGDPGDSAVFSNRATNLLSSLHTRCGMDCSSKGYPFRTEKLWWGQEKTLKGIQLFTKDQIRAAHHELDALAVGETEGHIVVEDSVHVFDPQRVNRPVEHRPSARYDREQGSCDAHGWSYKYVSANTGK